MYIRETTGEFDAHNQFYEKILIWRQTALFFSGEKENLKYNVVATRIFGADENAAVKNTLLHTACKS